MANSIGLTPAQEAHARDVIAVGHQLHATDEQITAAIACTLAESGLRNLANAAVPGSLALPNDGIGSDHFSVGIFQQQVPMWGSVTVCQSAIGSANLFYQQLLRDWNNTVTPWQNIQDVQRSAISDGSNYERQYARAQAIYSGLNTSTTPTENGLTVSDVKRINELLLLGGVISAATKEAESEIDWVYVHRLGRHVDPSGKKTYTDYMLNGGTINGVDAAVMNSAEFKTPQNQARIAKLKAKGKY